jgi:hypothetical protein
MTERDSWYPYAPDQQFGSTAAEDQRRIDDLLAVIDELLGDRPARRVQAGNRAPAVELAPRWDWLRTEVVDAPPTTASALEAAPFLRSG